jgi:two-component system, NarL family, sensor kinase
MEPVRRVTIRDKQPLLGPDLLTRPLNRFAITWAVLSLGVQASGAAQVIAGRGRDFAPPDHVAFALVAFLWWSMGLLVFLQRRSQRTGQLFLLSASSGAGFLALVSLDGTGLANGLIFAGGFMLCLAFLVSFVRAYTESRAWRPHELLLYVPAVALIWPGGQDLATRQTGMGWKLCLLAGAGYMVIAIFQAWRDLLQAPTAESAAQSRALVFGLVAGNVPVILLYVGPLVLTGSLLIGTGSLALFVFLFLLAMSYAALLFEFSESDLIVRRGVVYGLLTLVIIGAYGALGALLEVGRATVTGLGGGLAFVAVSIAVGTAFGPLQREAKRFADWLFYGRTSDRWETLQRLSARLGTVMQPGDLSHALVVEIRHALHLQGVFLLHRTSSDSFEMWRSGYAPCQAEDEMIRGDLTLGARILERALGDPPSPLLLVHARPLTAARRNAVPEEYRPLDELKVALAVPLVARSGLEAVLCLHAKLAHDAFDTDDLELLAPITRQAASALDNALLFSQLEEKVAELRVAYTRITHEQEVERGRLARELHDGTAQELAGLITLATVADRQLGSDGAVRDTLQRLKQQAEDAYHEVRRASHALRPPMLDDFGLAIAVSRYLGEFEQTTGIQIERQIDEIEGLDDDVELALFRVAQECMENVRKHSGASRTRLALERCDGCIVLEVEDDGRGLGTGQATGIGIAGMRERIEAVGGKLQVVGSPHCRVTVTIPERAPWK